MEMVTSIIVAAIKLQLYTSALVKVSLLKCKVQLLYLLVGVYRGSRYSRYKTFTFKSESVSSSGK